MDRFSLDFDAGPEPAGMARAGLLLDIQRAVEEMTKIARADERNRTSRWLMETSFVY